MIGQAKDDEAGKAGDAVSCADSCIQVTVTVILQPFLFACLKVVQRYPAGVAISNSAPPLIEIFIKTW